MRDKVLDVRIDEITRRLDTLEDRIAQQLDAIFRVIDDIREQLTNERVEAARVKTCPDPGACLQLLRRIEVIERRMEVLEKRMEVVWTWRASVVAVLLFILAAWPIVKSFWP